MKRITVYEYTNFDLVDVYFIDTENEIGMHDFKQGLTHDQAQEYINELITKHNMTETDIIKNNSFDEDEYLVQTEKMTIAEYKEWLEE